MRRDLFSAVSSTLLVSFIFTSAVPAFALKPQETAEKPAGLEELADQLLSPFVPSPRETTRRGFLTSVGAGAAALGAAALPSWLVAAEKLVEKPIAGARVKFDPKEISLSDLPADLVKGRTAVLVFIENDNNPADKEPGVWYVQPKDVDGAWHFPVRGNTVSVTTKREDHRAFRKGHVWAILLEDEAAVKVFREKVRTLPGHQGAEADTYLAQRNRYDLSALLEDKAFVEKTGLVAIAVDSEGKAAQLITSGLEERIDRAVEAWIELYSKEAANSNSMNLADRMARERLGVVLPALREEALKLLDQWVRNPTKMADLRAKYSHADVAITDMVRMILIGIPYQTYHIPSRQWAFVVLSEHQPVGDKAQRHNRDMLESVPQLLQSALSDAVWRNQQGQRDPEFFADPEFRPVLMKANDVPGRIVYDTAIQRVQYYPGGLLKRSDVPIERQIAYGNLVRAVKGLARNGYVEVREEKGIVFLAPPTDWSLARVLPVEEAVLEVQYSGVKTLTYDAGAGPVTLSKEGELAHLNLLSVAREVANGGPTIYLKIEKDAATFRAPPTRGIVNQDYLVRASGLEENLTVAGALDQISRYVRMGSRVVKYRGVEFSDMVGEITPDSGLFDEGVLRKAIGTVARNGLVRVESAGDGTWILPPAITSSTGVRVSVGAYELVDLARLGGYSVSPNSGSLADRVDNGFGRRIMDFDRVRAVGFYPPGFSAYTARNIHYIPVTGSDVSGAVQQVLTALGEIYLAALGARSLELRTGSLWAPGINGPVLLIGPTGVSSGLEEKLQIGVLPVTHHIDDQLPNQFLSGRVPAGEEAVKLLETNGISHPQLATQWIGVATVFDDLIGAGHGLSDVEKKEVVDRADLKAQEVQDRVAQEKGLRLQHVNFETKGLTPGGLQAGATGGDLKGVPTSTISDVIEHTAAFVMGEPGASSMQLEGLGAETFGSFPDEARALMVATHINPALEAAVLKRHNAKTVEEFLDPELPVDQLTRRVAELNGVHFSQVDVTIMSNDDSDMQALTALQQTYQGMQVHRVKAGTVVPSLAAVLGVNDGRVRLFLRRSGMTEAVYMAVLAGVFNADGSYVNFRVVSEQVKSEFARRYDWVQHVLQQMKVLRPDDWEEIRDGKKIFSSRNVTQPVVGAYTFLTNGRTDLNLPFKVDGVRQDGGKSSIYTLAFASNPNKQEGGFLWGSRDEYLIPATAGLEEAPRPIIGFFPNLTDRTAELSSKLLAGDSSAKGQATRLIKGAVNKSAPEFQQAFGELLSLSRGNMEVFAQTFERAVARQPATVRDAMLRQVRLIAQDPGAPNNIPPVSYFNPARYVYARLQKKSLEGFVQDFLSREVIAAQVAVASVDLSDARQKATTLESQLKEGRQTSGPYQYEIFWDSLVKKDGETYLTLELLLDGEQGYEKGVVLELQVVIPVEGQKPAYVSPYPLASSDQTALNFSVGLLDPIHFINTRFPEWRPKAQRDVYESRLEALKASGEKNKRQFIRPSERQGNNPRFFEPFFRAFLTGNVPLAYHIVDALASERDYGNQGGVGSVGNLASAIVRRGGIGATASWLLEEPDAAGTVAEEKRTLVYSYEKDHHRIDAVKDVEGFASELEPFLLAYPENLMTGWVSANLQDETKFINQEARTASLAAGAAITQTGVIDETVFGRLQETYNGKPVTEGLPNVFGMHWLRNRWLHHVVDSLAAEGVPVTPFNRWYIEPDYALDGKPQTVEELSYLTMMSWVSAQAHGHPLGPVVPSYGNVHGASAGNPSLALAGILQYAAQAAPLYGDPLPPDLLAVARKAPRGSFAVAQQSAARFNDTSLREEFLQTVTSAGERTEEEEAQLRGFVLAQLQKIPADVMQTLKEAEQVLLKEVAEAQIKKRQPKPLEEVAPDVSDKLNTLTARLDQEINPLPLERRAAITTHAASGLSAEQLSKAREYGVWVANKSTEFQNIITKQLEVVYLMAVNPAQAQLELSRMSAAQAAWNAHPLSSEELQRVEALYQAMYDAAAARAIKGAKTDAERDALRQAAADPLRPFPWFWRDNTGWSMEDPSGKDWSAFEWLPGAHGRYMFSMRDKMTGQGTDNTLLFPNALTWGLPPTVIRMAQAEIERTIHFYHQPSVMNAVGGAAEFQAKTGLEETTRAIAELDSPFRQNRLAALAELVELERRGVAIPTIGPVLSSYIHVHTTASYPGLPGVVSPARMVWAAHQAGADQIWLVDHETLLHIEEGSLAVQIVNQGAEKPLTPVFGIEFKAPVSPERTALRRALREGVASGDAAWVVAWGVPVDSDGKVSPALADLVAQFQEAKRQRAKVAIRQIQEKRGIPLSLDRILAMSLDGNVTDRQLAYVAGPKGLDGADSIRKEILNRIPLSPDYGFPPYEQVVDSLSRLGAVPTFTMQVSVSDLEGLIPELRQIGIKAFDLAGIEHQHSNALENIASVIALADKNSMPVVGGVDYRGDGAIGWPQAAAWMKDPSVLRGIKSLSAQPAAEGAPFDDGFVETLRFASGLEEVVREMDAAKWEQAPLARLYFETMDITGQPVSGNIFFFDGLPVNDAKLASVVEEDGASSLTTNPTIMNKNLVDRKDYWRPIAHRLWQQGLSVEESFLQIYHLATNRVANFLAPLRNRTIGKRGQVSMEADATASTQEALESSTRRIDDLQEFVPQGDRPGLFVKLPSLPGSTAAIPAKDEAGPAVARKRTSEGRSTNVTLGFFLQQFSAHLGAYVEGLADHIAALQLKYQTLDDLERDVLIQKAVEQVNSVFSLFMSRWDRQLDKYFTPAINTAVQEGRNDDAQRLRMLQGKTALAMGRFAGQIGQYVFGVTDHIEDDGNVLTSDEHEFLARLRTQYLDLRQRYHVNPMQLLIASSGVYEDQPYAQSLLYVEGLMGPLMSNTVPPDPFAKLAASVRNADGGINTERVAQLQRNMAAEAIPWMEQTAGNKEEWSEQVRRRPEERTIESRSASWILRQVQDHLLAHQPKPEQQTLEAVGRGLRSAGEQSFLKDQTSATNIIRQWFAEFDQVRSLTELAWFSRFKDLQIITKAGSGHPGGSLSAMEIMLALYDPSVMRYDASDHAIDPTQRWLNRDRVVLSKGHAVPAQYVALMNAGTLTSAEIEALRKDPDNFAQGHTTLSATPGIDFSTGALGYGAPAAAGMAVAAWMDGRDYHTFTVIGDGEMEKGPIYEMAQMAPKLGLDNLTAVVDYNQYQQNKPREGYTPLDYDRLAEFWRLNGWNVVTVDGEKLRESNEAHEQYVDQLRQALANSKTQKNGKPTVILARTIKGLGLSFIEDAFRSGDMSFHGKALSADQYDKAIREIAGHLNILTDSRTLAEIEADLENAGSGLQAKLRARQLNSKQIAEVNERNRVSSEEARNKRLAKAAQTAPSYVPGGKPVATREAAGAAWTFFGSLERPIGGQDPTKIVLVSISDLQDSESFVGFGKAHGVFSPKNPQGRLVELGIMEDAGAKLAEGMAATGLGYLPVIGTFDRFVELVLHAVNHAAQDGLRMVVHATHSGVEVGPDGTSQSGIETPAFIYAMAGAGDRVAMFEPSDANVTVTAVEQAVEAGKPAYVRLGRGPRPILDLAAPAGLRNSGVIVRRTSALSENGRITLVASGVTVSSAIEAAKLLEAKKVGATVLEVTSVTQADDPTQDNALLQNLEPGVPVYTVHDASVKALRGPVLEALSAAHGRGLFPELSANQPRIFSRGITVTGSASPERLLGDNRFLAPEIATDAESLIKANAEIGKGNRAVLPAGLQPSFRSGLEESDETWVTHAIDGNHVGKIMDAGEAGSVMVLPKAVLSSRNELYLQNGLRPPANLPKSVTVEDLPKTQDGTLEILKRTVVQDSDFIVLNAAVVGDQAHRWIPPLTTNPSRVLMTPEQSDQASTEDLAAAGSLSRQIKGVVNYGSLTISYVTVSDVTYAVIRSA